MSLGNERKPRCPGRYGLEQAVHEFLSQRHIPDRPRIRILQNEDEQRASENQSKGEQQDQTGMHPHEPQGIADRFSFHPSSGSKKIDPNYVSQSAEHDHQHGHDHDQIMRAVFLQTIRADNVDAGIAERRDRSEKGTPDPPSCPKLRTEHRHIKDRPQSLHDQRHAKNPAKELQDFMSAVQREHFLQCQYVPEGERALCKIHEKHNSCNDAQSADLDQSQNDDLAKHAPVRTGVHHHRTRHANAGRRSKQGLQRRRMHSGSRGERQHQKKCSDQDQDQKS